MKLGRNDPCHCGSGKKYKRCHLALDEQSHASVQAAPATTEPEGPAPDLERMAKEFRQHRRSQARKERGDPGQIEARTQFVLGLMEKWPEVEAASTALNAHQAAFERLWDDEKALTDRTRELFQNERFAALRFSAEDVERAFQKVGYLSQNSPPSESVELLRGAMLHLADRARREKMSLELLLHLPYYVAQGQFMEGWLIQRLANDTIEFEAETNAFLFEMFSHGYDAWVERQSETHYNMLREAGLDPERLRSMSVEEVDAWLQGALADPAQRAKMDAIFRAHPDQQARATAQMMQLEGDSVKLLEREDAQELLLPLEEAEPWVPKVLEVLDRAVQRFPEVSGKSKKNSRASKRFTKMLLPVVGEMAQSIFTPQRIQELVEQLRKYRIDRLTAGDDDVAGWALGALASLEGETKPERNYFLVTLCYVCVQALVAEACGNKEEIDAGEESTGEPAG